MTNASPDLANKRIIDRWREAQYNLQPGALDDVANALFAPDAVCHLCHPLGDLIGPDALLGKAYRPLLQALPDLERRDYIRIAGRTQAGDDWVGCAGFYCGVFVAPWLDIPPTGQLLSMRFHEFYRLQEGQVVEMQAIWDIADVMRQARAWPLAPSLGHEWHIPGPATADGVVHSTTAGEHQAEGEASCQLIMDMLEAMQRHPREGGPDVMELDRFWHPNMMWYGPSGIGTARGQAGFRHWHQIPFLSAMPDRGQFPDDIECHFFGEAAYAAVTGWPDMMQTLSDGGWLGLAPTGQKIHLRSLDFWRLENGCIRENWVLVDLLDVYAQVGVDVFARLREFNKSRVGGQVVWPPLDS